MGKQSVILEIVVGRPKVIICGIKQMIFVNRSFRRKKCDMFQSTCQNKQCGEFFILQRELLLCNQVFTGKEMETLMAEAVRRTQIQPSSFSCSCKLCKSSNHKRIWNKVRKCESGMCVGLLRSWSLCCLWCHLT